MREYVTRIDAAKRLGFSGPWDTRLRPQRTCSHQWIRLDGFEGTPMQHYADFQHPLRGEYAYACRNCADVVQAGDRSRQ